MVLVSSLPVIVFGFGAALSHLLRGGHSESKAVSEVRPKGALEPLSGAGAESGSDDVPESALKSAPKAAPRVAARPKPKLAIRQIKSPTRVTFYAAAVAAEELPSLRRIRADLHVGQEKARVIQAELTAAMADAAKPAALAA